MKNVILLLFLLTHTLVFSQDKLPKYYINGNDTLGITISMSQLKRIKNDLQLKSFFETMAISCDCTMNKMVEVVDDYERTLGTYRVSLKRADSSSTNNLNLLNTCLDSRKEEERLKNICEKQSLSKDTIISNNNKQINNLKLEKAIGWWGAGGFFVTTLVLSIILALH